MGGVSNGKCDLTWHIIKGRMLITHVWFDGQMVFDAYKGVNRLTHDIKSYIKAMEGNIEFAKAEDIQ